MENRCVACGRIIPEGRQVCINCEKGYLPDRDDEREDEEKEPFVKKGR